MLHVIMGGQIADLRKSWPGTTRQPHKSGALTVRICVPNVCQLDKTALKCMDRNKTSDPVKSLRTNVFRHSMKLRKTP